MEMLNGVISNSIPCKFNNNNTRIVALKTKSSFSNNNVHLEYYGEVDKGKGKNKGWNGISTKKKMKLLKGLTKDLSTFSDMGFGFSFDCHDDVNSMTISEAAKVLLAQLKKLRSEEKHKNMKKQQKKKKCKNDDSSESSSSESDSSDSECDEVVDIKRLKDAVAAQPIKRIETRLTLPSLPALKGPTSEQMTLHSDKDCCNMILETTLKKDSGIEILSSETLSRKIEVCMGGKCKKSGAPALIEKFQKVIGDEGVVVGCKCMGKCKSGPNVKVVSSGEKSDGDSLRNTINPLYIGVGLEDVGLIVASCFGEDLKGLDLSISGVTS